MTIADMVRRSLIILCILCTAASEPLMTAWSPPRVRLPKLIATYSAVHGFLHNTGRRTPYGWEAYYRMDHPGQLIEGRMNGGDLLEEGTYQYDLYLNQRSGHLPGLFSDANDAVRLEAVDRTTEEVLMQRTFSRADILHGKRFSRLSVAFSTWRRNGHKFEPRVYWPGLVGLSVHHVELRKRDDFSIPVLAEKARRLDAAMREDYLTPDGFVVVRDTLGGPEDLGDTAIWTALWAASCAWRYQATGSIAARTQMEHSLWALHRLSHDAPLQGTLVRYIYPDGRIYAQPPSKDTYTGFFFAVGQCLPWVKDARLKSALQKDIEVLAGHFLDHEFAFVPEKGLAVDFKPYPSPTMLEGLWVELQEQPAVARRIARGIRLAQTYFLLHGSKPLSGFSRAARVFPRADIPTLRELLVPLSNDLLVSIRRLDRLVERSARVPERFQLVNSPYQKLHITLERMLQQLPFDGETRRIRKPQEVRVFASQAVLALHVLKVAGETLPKPNRFERAYTDHLWDNEQFLKTVAEWNNIDDELTGSIMGETRSRVERPGGAHVSLFALFNLNRLEKDARALAVYHEAFVRQAAPLYGDGNPMAMAMQEAGLPAPRQTGLGLWALHRYPEDRLGRGNDYWRYYGRTLGEAYGGLVGNRTRDPLPPDLRPRDAFLWQRNPRSLSGDHDGWHYPPLDYLVAYWLARATVGIPSPRERS